MTQAPGAMGLRAARQQGLNLLLPAFFNDTAFHAGAGGAELVASAFGAAASASGAAALQWRFQSSHGPLVLQDVAWDGATSTWALRMAQ